MPDSGSNILNDLASACELLSRFSLFCVNALVIALNHELVLAYYPPGVILGGRTVRRCLPEFPFHPIHKIKIFYQLIFVFVVADRCDRFSQLFK